jgi:hypothetical protein
MGLPPFINGLTVLEETGINFSLSFIKGIDKGQKRV